MILHSVCDMARTTGNGSANKGFKEVIENDGEAITRRK